MNDSRFVIDQNGNLFTNVTFPEIISEDKIILSIATKNKSDPLKIIVSIEFTKPNIYRPQFSFMR